MKEGNTSFENLFHQEDIVSFSAYPNIFGEVVQFLYGKFFDYERRDLYLFLIPDYYSNQDVLSKCSERMEH